MTNKKQRRFSRLHYVIFILKPCWKYGKGYLITISLFSMVLQPLSSYLSTLLPKVAIDAVVNGVSRREILWSIVSFGAGIAALGLCQKVFDLVFCQSLGGLLIQKIRDDINKKALYTDFKYYDQSDFFTQFIYAQDHFPNEVSLVITILPLLLKNIVTIVIMSSIVFSANPVMLALGLFFCSFDGAG